jgi:signal transduction histidine kinase
VHTTPFEVAGTSYLMVSFSDISGQRRHQALERIFFHDILNTVSSFRVYLDLLERESAASANRVIIGRLQSICDTLVEEIQGQRLILSAENRTLRVQSNLIDARNLAEELISAVGGLQIAGRKRIVAAEQCCSFALVSDDALIKRILSNMLKNALEASATGQTVTLAYRSTPEKQACFEVHNPGCMEPAVQRQVFQRYFSTKGKDRGLGTWGMKLLAEEYLGGSVSFESAPQTGTTFRLLLPLKPQRFA